MTLVGPIIRGDTRRQVVSAFIAMESETAEDAIYHFLEASGWSDSRVVESWVATPDKLQLLGLDIEPGWWLGLGLSDVEWARFEAGELNGVQVEIEGKEWEVAPTARVEE